ncbi:MAG: hypothetical protein ACK55Z_28780, partial [bacterium]
MTCRLGRIASALILPCSTSPTITLLLTWFVILSLSLHLASFFHLLLHHHSYHPLGFRARAPLVRSCKRAHVDKTSITRNTLIGNTHTHT